MKESEIRDILAEKICVLEEGLTLQKKEQYIPNELGTRGFIDLYARDVEGNHVLIELKRSKPATRETLNEIIKYVEGVKTHFGSRDDEIRVIVASTEWSELLVPYSRFIRDTNISVIGIKLDVDETTKDISAELVLPLETDNGRFIAPWYDVFWYKNSESYDRGIETIKKSCREKNIKDYVISTFVLKIPMPSIPQEKRRGALEAMFGSRPKSELELFSYVVFFAFQIKTEKQYLDILKLDSEKYEEAICVIEGMSDDEKLCTLHEYLVDLDPKPYSDDLEIGNPAKFDKYLNDDNFILSNISKFGAFERNRLLTQDILITELKGLNGSCGHKINRTISLSSVSQVSLLKKEVEGVLVNNSIWSERILRNIEELNLEFPDGSLEFNLYNPSTGIFTIYFALSKDDSIGYLPSYYMKVSSGNRDRVYFGSLDMFEEPLTFVEIIDKYYSGSIGALVHSITWGGGETRDVDVLEDLGLTYRNYRCDIELEDKEFFIMRDGRWRKCEPVNPYERFGEYINSNSELIDEIMGELTLRDNGTYFEDSALHELSITITRHEVESRDITNSMTKLACLMTSKNLAQKMRRKVEISFDGYSFDPRNLYDIEDVRHYVESLSREFPYLFYFARLDSIYAPLRVIAACHVASEQMSSGVAKPYRMFLEQQFVGLNEITEWLGLPLEENMQITDEVMNYLSDNY
ncbi:TPA: DUF91 domain-containing protein [Vibrio parahaemolyticus]|nr:DUF91 domain-containing protein [Vibrio parahaemolyticus]